MENEGQSVFDAAEAQLNEEKGENTEASTADSSTESEETSTGQDGDDGEVPKDLDTKTPLHKDARFKRVVEEKNRLKRELAEARAEAQQRTEQKTETRKVDSKSRPSWFTKFYGTDENADEAWEGLTAMTSQAREDAKQEALAELSKQSETREQQEAYWKRHNEEQMDTLEEEGEVFDRNALIKQLVERPIYNEKGELDFRTALDIVKAKSPAGTSIEGKRKAGALATGTKTGSGSEPKKSNSMTPSDIRKWRAQEGF